LEEEEEEEEMDNFVNTSGGKPFCSFSAKGANFPG